MNRQILASVVEIDSRLCMLCDRFAPIGDASEASGRPLCRDCATLPTVTIDDGDRELHVPARSSAIDEAFRSTVPLTAFASYREGRGLCGFGWWSPERTIAVYSQETFPQMCLIDQPTKLRRVRVRSIADVILQSSGAISSPEFLPTIEPSRAVRWRESARESIGPVFDFVLSARVTLSCFLVYYPASSTFNSLIATDDLAAFERSLDGSREGVA